MSIDNEFDFDHYHEEELGEGFNLKQMLGEVELPTRQSKGRLGLLCSTLFLGAVGLTPSQEADAATFSVTNNGDAGAGSLRQAIIDANTAPGPDTIDFSSVTGTIPLTTGQLYIDDDVTITGPGAANLTIDGTYNSRIFDIESADVSISGLTLTNGAEGSSDGGGIYSDSSDLTLTNVTISNCYAAYGGGGIFSYYGSLVVDGCTISGNTANEVGGGIYCEDSDGGITIDNSTITGNTANGDGGGVAVDSTNASIGVLKITDSTISNNEADGDGGGLYVTSYGIMTIDGSTISGNTSIDNGGGVSAQNLDTLVINDSYIQNNYAEDDGGGASIEDTRYQVSILDSTISGNTAEFGDGGGVYATGFNYGSQLSVTLNNSDVTGNTANNGDGGGLAVSNSVYSLQIIDSDISNNYAYQTGGGISADDSTSYLDLEISNSTISGNTADDDGGGIALSSDTQYGSVSLENTQITGNVSGGSGGGISSYSRYFSRLTKFEVHGSTLSGNTADSDGGGLSFYFEGDSDNGSTYVGAQSIPQFFNSTISNNVSENGYGGGIDIDVPQANGAFILDTCTVSGNTADGDGGAVSLYGRSIYYDEPLYESSSGFTGALKITNSTISSNVSGADGGGVSLYDESTYNENNSLTITNSTISGNTANDNGGGLSIASYINLVVKQSTLSGNQATSGDGGGAYIYTEGNDNLIQNSTITGNSAGSSGGGLYNYDQRTNVLSTIVSGNTAPSGPDLYTDGDDFDVSFSLIGDTSDAGYDDEGNNQFNVDPLLGPLADNGGSTQTHLLLTGSPAIDAGLNFSGSLFDQRGTPFVRSEGDTDIGATEFNAAPVFTSAPSATPNPALVGDTVTFGVAVTDNNPGTLTFAWDFGDGSSGTGAAPTHVYTADGTFTAVVTVTNKFGKTASGNVAVVVNPVPTPPPPPPPGEPLLGVGPDTDGDGFSDDFETAAGTDPNDASSMPFGTSPLTSTEPLILSRLIVKLKLSAIVGKDKILMKGLVPVPDGFNFEGQRVTFDIGGVTKSFTLDRLGNGIDGLVRVSFRKPKNGQSKVVLTKKFLGDFKDILNTSSNLNNATVNNELRNVRVSLAFNNTGFVVDQNVVYRARQDKIGKATTPR